MTTEQLNAEQMRAAAVAAHLAADNADTVALVWADALEESGDAARAEFVRVQVELAQPEPKFHISNECAFSRPNPMCPRCAFGFQRLREDELLRHHQAKWRRVGECPKCCGYLTPRRDCILCYGTRDVGGLGEGKWQEAGGFEVWVELTVQWRRGLPDAVEVPTLAEVLEQRCKRCTGTLAESNERGGGCAACEGGSVRPMVWRPTPWAQAVVKSHPSVTRFIVRDKSPINGHRAGAVAMWLRLEPGENLSRACLPEPVYGFLQGARVWRIPGGPMAKEYSTCETANDALARALMRVVRASQCS